MGGRGEGTDEGEKTRCPLNGLNDGELIGRGITTRKNGNGGGLEKDEEENS